MLNDKNKSPTDQGMGISVFFASSLASVKKKTAS